MAQAAGYPAVASYIQMNHGSSAADPNPDSRSSGADSVVVTSRQLLSAAASGAHLRSLSSSGGGGGSGMLASPRVADRQQLAQQMQQVQSRDPALRERDRLSAVERLAVARQQMRLADAGVPSSLMPQLAAQGGQKGAALPGELAIRARSDPSELGGAGRAPLGLPSSISMPVARGSAHPAASAAVGAVPTGAAIPYGSLYNRSSSGPAVSHPVGGGGGGSIPGAASRERREQLASRQQLVEPPHMAARLAAVRQAAGGRALPLHNESFEERRRELLAFAAQLQRQKTSSGGSSSNPAAVAVAAAAAAELCAARAAESPAAEAAPAAAVFSPDAGEGGVSGQNMRKLSGVWGSSGGELPAASPRHPISPEGGDSCWPSTPHAPAQSVAASTTVDGSGSAGDQAAPLAEARRLNGSSESSGSGGNSSMGPGSSGGGSSGSGNAGGPGPDGQVAHVTEAVLHFQQHAGQQHVGGTLASPKGPGRGPSLGRIPSEEALAEEEQPSTSQSGESR